MLELLIMQNSSQSLQADRQKLLDDIALKKESTQKLCNILDENLDILFYKVKDHKNCDKHRMILNYANLDCLPYNEKIVKKFLNSRRIYSSGVHFKVASLIGSILLAILYNPFSPNFSLETLAVKDYVWILPPLFLVFVIYLVLELSTYTLYRLPSEFKSN